MNLTKKQTLEAIGATEAELMGLRMYGPKWLNRCEDTNEKGLLKELDSLRQYYRDNWPMDSLDDEIEAQQNENQGIDPNDQYGKHGNTKYW